MKLIISGIVLAALAACSTPPEPVIVTVNSSIAVAAAPKPITTRPVTFTVITDKDSDIFANHKVLYAVTVDTYEAISYNTQEMLRYIKDQKSIIRYYENSLAN